jgi:beta-lactamase superfamily II metal-dependent hydrolase
MITHAHGDHMQLANAFLKDYSNQIDLEMVVYNFPEFASVTVEKESTADSISLVSQFLSVLSEKYPNTKHYIYHTGDRLLLPGCEIEFLIAQEDFLPNGFPYINHTSGAWRMKIENKTLLITGDVVDAACTWLTDVYGTELKSDILQVAHHGYNGGTLKLYQLVDPVVCLWPAPKEYLSDISYNPFVNTDYNRYLLDNYDRHYHADQDTVLIFSDLSLKTN